MFFKYAAERGPLVVNNGDVYVAGAGGKAKLAAKIHGTEIPLLKVDLDSAWKVYAEVRRNETERKVQDAVRRLAAEVSTKPEALAPLLRVEQSYASMLSEILFEAGAVFTERAGCDENFDEYLQQLEQHLGGKYEPGDAGILTRLIGVPLEPFSAFAAARIRKTAPRAAKLGAWYCDATKVLKEGDRVVIKKALRGKNYKHGYTINEIPLHTECTVLFFDKKHDDAIVVELPPEYEHLTMNYGPCKKMMDPGEIEKIAAGEPELLADFGNGVVECAPANDSFEARLDSIFEEYQAAYVEAMVRQRLDESGAVKPALARRASIMSAVLRRGEADFGSWGIKKEADAFVVYLNLPQYALRNWMKPEQDNYIIVPASQVGVKIYTHDNVSKPYMLQPLMHHPFVHDRDMTTICMPFSSGRTFRESVVNKLSGAKITLMTGLTKSRGYQLAYAIYHYYRMTFNEVPIAEIQRMDIPITNE